MLVRNETCLFVHIHDNWSSISTQNELKNTATGELITIKTYRFVTTEKALACVVKMGLKLEQTDTGFMACRIKWGKDLQEAIDWLQNHKL